ncbi:zinc finger protein 260-like [Plodia interpunctella]|uniref:zinc finger protein 260-like n=1 Tax=Plodia interpunctella TaxID=58824 RepID=UPI002367649F|nr:zinc finger protein 260-like [Plodia interpunctella]
MESSSRLAAVAAAKMLDIASCCRVCMKQDCNLLSLFDHLFVDQQVVLLAEVLMNCTGIKVSQEDGLPQLICGDCAKTLETMCAFRFRALISESEFRKLVKSTPKNEGIKSEMKQEDDDLGHMDLLLEDLSEYTPVDLPKQECESQSFDNSDSQAESYNCDQCSKKYATKNKFLKHVKSHENPMYCDICKKVFYSKRNLNKHMKKHSPQLFKCNFCHEQFSSEAFLFEHIVHHTDKANVKCPKCDIIFSTKRIFAAHLRKKHEAIEKVSKGAKCAVCQKYFTSKYRLKKHMTVHSEEQHHMCEKHSDDCSQGNQLLQNFNWNEGIKNEYDIYLNVDDHKVQDNLSKKIKCDICTKEFSTQSHFKRHMKMHSDEKQSYGRENQQQNMNNCDDIKDECEVHDTCDDVSKKIKCDICAKEFVTKSLLNRHMKLHSEERPYECTKCSKSYSRQDQLLQHMKWHDGIKPYICSYCSKAFNQLCSLKDHIRTHTGETPYLCSECGKSFTNSSNLRQHLMRHSGLKPFTCNLCPKSFTTKGQMTAHMTTHTGAHPYKCEECGSSFTKANSLKKHKLIHLGVKPFACETCNMRFSCKEHLKRHNRIHTGEKPYKCKFCERAFTQSNDLAKHIRTHVGQNIYQCTVCNMRFRLISELKQHYPTHYVNGDEIPKIPISKGVEAPVLMLKPEPPPLIEIPGLKHNMDPRITITINSDGLDKNGLAGDITINLSPEKS